MTYNSYDHRAKTINGSRWAHKDELTAQLTRLDLQKGGYKAAGLPVISDGSTAYVDTSDNHTMVFGSTGSKKTRNFVLPMMYMFAEAGECVLVSDPKGEIFTKTSGHFQDRGYDIYPLDLRDPDNSFGWSPLFEAGSLYKNGMKEEAISLINDMAETIFTNDSNAHVDPFWEQKSKAVFEGLCCFLIENNFENRITNFWALNELAEHMEDGDEMSALVDLMPSDSIARMRLKSVLNSCERTLSNIMSSYQGPMQRLYSQPSVINLLTRWELDFRTITNSEKFVIYLILPDESSRLHFIANLFLKTFYQVYVREAYSNSENKKPARLNFVLDEFANLPKITDFDCMISAGRSRNIRFFLFVQSLKQLNAKYGAEIADVIRGNCANWVFLNSRELELLEQISALCGNTPSGERLISVQMLQHLNKETGEALFLYDRHYPYISNMPDISQYSRFALFRRWPVTPSAYFIKPPAYRERRFRDTSADFEDIKSIFLSRCKTKPSALLPQKEKPVTAVVTRFPKRFSSMNDQEQIMALADSRPSAAKPAPDAEPKPDTEPKPDAEPETVAVPETPPEAPSEKKANDPEEEAFVIKILELAHARAQKILPNSKKRPDFNPEGIDPEAQDFCRRILTLAVDRSMKLFPDFQESGSQQS